MPGDAEVLQQQVAGKDVVQGQVADGLAVVQDRRLCLVAVHLVDIQVQRPHAPLDVALVETDLVALDVCGQRGLAL
ncbi:hypothetical protein D3C83_29940 [compost metagenome]